MPAHGKLEPFDAQSEILTDYLERFEFYCVANEVRSESKKKAIFLSSVGQSTFEKVKALISPQTLDAASFEEIKNVLKVHFSPAKIEIAERYRFFQRKQSSEESVAEYIASLRKLAVHCSFGLYLDTALRDQFVCGLNDARCQKELLCVSSLSLQDAVQHARSYEAVARESAAIHPTQPTSTADPTHHQVEFVSAGSRGRSCFRCGSSTHLANRCRFMRTVCFACGLRGHLAAVCRNPGAGAAAGEVLPPGGRPASRGDPTGGRSGPAGGAEGGSRPGPSGREGARSGLSSRPLGRGPVTADNRHQKGGRSGGREVHQTGELEEDSGDEYSVLHTHQPRGGQPVLVRDLRPAATEKWQRAVVVAIGGPLTYSVRLPDGRIRLAHVDHLLADGSASVTAERGPLDARVTVPPPTEPGKLRGPAVPCVMDARGRFPYISDYNKRATCEGNRGARASEPVEAAPALRRSARLAKKTC
ncbi:uncharacterized protein LOC122393776 isoform X4 [Amphibalanus amphitrite]|uniref:uncharacterized protein LOC122393776 isoform X4 n=1 Tax=Amphibalanus amphitrite TaxID=1232801 RepID=UPI001C91A6A0|nr:uncharacterized protein LOC122393776 isoform X4 [Amphibalanus amphitrite]